MAKSTGVQGTATGGGKSKPKVKLVSGESIEVMVPAEERWFNRTRDEYIAQTKFTETTDLRDIDRLLVHELLVYRWTNWIASGSDYEGHLADDAELQRQIKLYSAQISEIKTSMGLTKKARDAANDRGTVADYVSELKRRAKAFGIHRENQLVKALSLFEELSTVVTSFLRSDQEERIKMGFETEADIVKWIDEVAIPEYRRIDEHFRQKGPDAQRYWAGQL